MPHLMPCVGSHNTWGGIENWLFDLLTYLRGSGWQITIGLTRGLIYNRPEVFRSAHPGFASVEFDGRTGTSYGRVDSVMEALMHVKPDIVLPLNVVDVYSAIAALKSMGTEIRAVATLHYFMPEAFADVRALAPWLDMCVAVNPLQYQYLANDIVPGDGRLQCIQHGVAHVPSRRERGHGRPLHLVYVGRLIGQEKRIRDAVALVRELETLQVEFHLSFVGSGPGEFDLKTELRDQIESRKVAFLGYQPSDKIQGEIFPTQDVLLLFSVAEAGPLVLLEAMAQGVVPVSSDFIGVHAQGWLQPRKTGMIFPVGDMRAAARCIQELASDRELLSRLSSQARVVANEFSLEKSHRSWDRTLRALLDVPVRYSPAAGTSPFTSTAAAGRLDSIGLPPRVSNRIRRLLRRWPRFSSGYDEWPGTMSALNDSEKKAIWEELRRLDGINASTHSGESLRA